MSVSLAANLQTALDGTDHKPRCRITSYELAGDLPFDGYFLDSETVEEQTSSLILHSSGRMLCFFRKNDWPDNDPLDYNDLWLAYTDTDRTTWTQVKVQDFNSAEVWDVDAVELTDGSGNIGLLMSIYQTSTQDRLAYMVVTQTGTVVTAYTTWKNSPASQDNLRNIEVCTIGATSDKYMAVWEWYDDSTADYYMQYQVSTGFTGWTSAASTVPFSGMVSSREKQHPALLDATSDGNGIRLFFEYADDVVDSNKRFNIFETFTLDEGSTWSTPATITSYNSLSASGIEADAALKQNGDIRLGFTQDASVLKFDHNSTGWCDGSVNNKEVSDMAYDSTNGYLCVKCSNTGVGSKYLQIVYVIDVSTWTVVGCWTENTSPAFNDFWTDAGSTWWHTMSVDEGYIAIPGSKGIALINIDSDTITEYWFEDYDSGGITVVKNVDADLTTRMPFGDAIYRCALDVSNNRLYVLAFALSFQQTYTIIGYIDITDAEGDNGYPFTELNDETPWSPSQTTYAETAINFGYIPSTDQLWMTAWAANENDGAYVKWWNASTGTAVKLLNQSSSGFPPNGIRAKLAYAGGKLWGGLAEYASGDPDVRGLISIDMTSYVIKSYRPTHETVDDYVIRYLWASTDETELVMSSSYGVLKFEIGSETWTHYTNDTVPGMTADGEDYFLTCAWNETDSVLYAAPGDISYDDNTIAFKEDGTFTIGYYLDGVLSGGTYTFPGTPSQMHQEYGGTDPQIAYDDEWAMWSTWTHQHDGTEYSIKWDRTNFSPDISDYILAGSQLRINWEVDNVAKAEFQLSRGDLFDPTNTNSIYAPLTTKGRYVDIELGEKYNGTEYYQSQGNFMIVGAKTSYSRTGHPITTVYAEDQSTFWDDIVIHATQGYWNETYANMMDDILQTHAQLDSGDFTIPSLSSAHDMYAQWVDASVQDILDDIYSHYGLFGHWGTDGKYTILEYDLSGDTIDHDYISATAILDSDQKLMNYQATDEYSSFINRVTVRGEARGFYEVVWDEEAVAEVDGTLGFWSKQDTIKVYYNDDQTRRCRYPRMEVIQSINDFSPILEFLGAAATEEIGDEDPNETWVEIDIESIDRSIYAFAFAAAVVAFGYSATTCDWYNECGAWILATNIALGLLIEVLTAVGEYRYIIHARPIGKEKQMIQASANDTVLQNQLNGTIVEQTIDDALGQTTAELSMTANKELDIVKAQRKRVTFTKSAHLQDEIGDTIKVRHPISNQELTLFVAKLTRTFSKPALGAKGGGQFTDAIEGWVL